MRYSRNWQREFIEHDPRSQTIRYLPDPLAEILLDTIEEVTHIPGDE